MRINAFVVAVGIALGCGGSPKSPALDNKPTSNQLVPVSTSQAKGLQLKVVDSASPYMKKLFAQVGSERGKATDAVAAAAGITAELDMWSDDAGKRSEDYYLVASDHDGTSGRSAIERYVSALATKDSTFKLPADRELGFELMSPGKWRSYYLHREVALDGTVVASATQALDPNTGQPIVLLEYTPDGGKQLAELTRRIVGGKLAILLGGTIKSAPVINGAITGGKASITMGGGDVAAQEREASMLVETLTKKK